MTYIFHYTSPFGPITVASDGNSITGLWFDGQEHFASTVSGEQKEEPLPVFAETGRWLDIYFSGREPDFTPPLRLCSTPFREMVWEILLTIPYGKTMTYGEIAAITAQRMGIARMSAQAVGGAVGHNPISIIVPCHRVIGANGTLTGYAGGIDKKAALLKIEQNNS